MNLFKIVRDYVLREAIEGHENSFGITIKSSQGCRTKPEKGTDLKLADDIARFSAQFQQARELLRNGD